jgi:hypothetical protein
VRKIDQVRSEEPSMAWRYIGKPQQKSKITDRHTRRYEKK